MAEHDTALLADLARHAAWAVLRRTIQGRMDVHFRMLATEFMTRGKQPDYAELQWARGYFAACKHLLDTPETALARFERELKKASQREDVTESA